MRCDKDIINLALWVAKLDPDRLDKPLKARQDADDGEVLVLAFARQEKEAEGVAAICRYLLDVRGYSPKDILILMRSDKNGAFSSVLRKALESQAVPVTVPVEGTPLDGNEGRIFLSFLRLIVYDGDSLALRTLLHLRKNQIGRQSCQEIHGLALSNGEAFRSAANRVMKEPELIQRLGSRISSELHAIQVILDKHRDHFHTPCNSSEPDGLSAALADLAKDVILEASARAEVLSYLEAIITEAGCADLRELLQTLSLSLGGFEQEMDTKCVNIMDHAQGERTYSKRGDNRCC